MASGATRRRRVGAKRTKPTKRRPLGGPARKRPSKRAAEKRRTSRIQPFVVPCRVSAGRRTLTGYLTDLSPQGARVSSDDPLAAGVRSVAIEVRFSRTGPASRLPARVRWRKTGRRKAGEATVFGVTFAGIARGEQALLRSVIEEFRRRAALVAS